MSVARLPHWAADLACITMWQLRGTSDKCPFCDARHLGLVLILHIEKLKDRVQNQVCDGSEESGGIDIKDLDICYDVDTFDYSEDDDCILGDYWQLSAFIERHVA
ncbi:hypothetical protein GGF42_007752 [Coemansia sp. RSA 2424]|nr:hypothetical protein GGF42_007752 [Coemansia sp. RSA 2424]